jgi:hypothetical protein
VLIFLFVLIAAFFFNRMPGQEVKEVTFTTFTKYVKEEQFKKVTIDEMKIIGQTRDGKVYETYANSVLDINYLNTEYLYKQSEEKEGDNDHEAPTYNVLTRRPGYAAHLGANIAKALKAGLLVLLALGAFFLRLLLLCLLALCRLGLLLVRLLQRRAFEELGNGAFLHDGFGLAIQLLFGGKAGALLLLLPTGRSTGALSFGFLRHLYP